MEPRSSWTRHLRYRRLVNSEGFKTRPNVFKNRKRRKTMRQRLKLPRTRDLSKYTSTLIRKRRIKRPKRRD